MYTVRTFDQCAVCGKLYTRRGMTNHINKSHRQIMTSLEGAHLEANLENERRDTPDPTWVREMFARFDRMPDREWTTEAAKGEAR